ncbi:hypothetical protein ACW0JT_05275 [Arthrobacter sp. SA17]
MSKKIESVEDDAGKVTRYRRHPNGGGLIGPGAEVEESSFIGSTTYIEAGACVGSGCRIGDGSWIDRRARIGDLALIGDGVYVGEERSWATGSASAATHALAPELKWATGPPLTGIAGFPTAALWPLQPSPTGPAGRGRVIINPGWQPERTASLVVGRDTGPPRLGGNVAVPLLSEDARHSQSSAFPCRQ